MKITLCRDDMLQAASQIKQIRRINSLEFDNKTVVCKVSLDNKAIGIFGTPENWIITLIFAHEAGTVTATLDIASDAQPLGGISSIINSTAQILLNSITNIVGLEEKILSAIKLPDFASSTGKSITVDLDKLLQDKLNGNVHINTIDCNADSISLDISFKF